MGKDQKKEVMGKIYREFSRQKYNKYKHQYPKMRESEIVSKIIREWDMLDNIAKEKLKKQYEQNKILTAEDISESQTAKKSEQFKKVERQTTPRRMDMSEADESSFLQEAKAAQKFYKTAEKIQDNVQVEQFRSKSPARHKAIAKASTTDYITFFRHYYEKYTIEHPKWTSSQISKIIRLLWKKNKSQKRHGILKYRKSKLEGSGRQKKPVSGRTAFRKIRNLNRAETSKLWKHLPIESRHYWQGEAQGRLKQLPRQHKVTLRASTESDCKGFDFLSKVIR